MRSEETKETRLTRLLASVGSELGRMSANVADVEAALSHVLCTLREQAELASKIDKEFLRDLQDLDRLRQSLAELSGFLNRVGASDIDISAPDGALLEEFALKDLGARVLARSDDHDA